MLVSRVRLATMDEFQAIDFESKCRDSSLLLFCYHYEYSQEQYNCFQQWLQIFYIPEILNFVSVALQL